MTIWHVAPTSTEKSKKQRDNTKKKTPPKRLRTDLGRSVGATPPTPLVWLNRFTSAQTQNLKLML